MAMNRNYQTAPYYYSKAVGPKEAKELLALNIKNRRLSGRIVSKYAKDMADGNWINNGDVIRISSKGTLIDGQHRLSAIIEAGVTVTLNFAEGLDPDSFSTIDRGKGRTTGQILELQGFKNAKILAAVSKRLIHWENTLDQSKFTFMNEGFQRITDHEQMAYVKHHASEIHKTYESLTGSLPLKKCGAPSALITALIIIQRYNSFSSKKFIEGLVTGANLIQNSPIALLRDRMVDPPDRRGAAWDLELMALTIKSFNKFISNNPIKTLAWRQVGNYPEKFPVPSGVIYGD